VREIPPYTLRVGTTPTSPGEPTVLFENSEHIVVPPNVSQHMAQFVEGRRVDERFAGTGRPHQLIRLASRPVMIEEIVEPSIRVAVDGQIWTRVLSFVRSQPDDTHYVLSVDGDGIGEIVFGDGIRGKVPADGAVIDVRYRVGGGVQGNLEAGRINRTVLAPSYVIGVTNPEPSVGGTEAEPLARIRLFAPLAIAEAGQLNSLRTVRAFLESRPSVARAKVFLDIDVVRAIILVRPGFVFQSVRDKLRAEVLERLVMGHEFELLAPTVREVDVSVRVWAVETASRAQVEAQVRAAIDRWLDPLAVDEHGRFINDFGRDLRLSDLGVLLKSVDGIFDYEILEPSANVPIADEEIVTNTHTKTEVRVEVIGGLATGMTVPGGM
jgi:predicted phage baseplate assembly protein